MQVLRKYLKRRILVEREKEEGMNAWGDEWMEGLIDLGS
jgi:hypothetical protein